MASVGQVRIDVVANTKQFGTGLNKGKAQLKSFRSSVALSKAGVIGLGVATAAATAGIGLLIKGVGKLANFARGGFESLDKLAKSSAKLGIAPAQLQLLRVAAEEAGVETTALDKSLEKLSKGTSEAARGIGTAKNAFELLNLNASDMLKLPMTDRILAISKAMKNVTDQGHKNAIAMDLFGRAGGDMLNLLNQTEAQIKAVFDARTAQGGLFSAEELARVEKANDAWASMVRGFTLMRDQLTIDIAPFFTAIAKATEQFRQIFAKDMFKKFSDTLTNLAKPENMANMITTLGSAVSAFVRAMSDVADSFNEAVTLMRELRSGKDAPGAAAAKLATLPTKGIINAGMGIAQKILSDFGIFASEKEKANITAAKQKFGLAVAPSTVGDAGRNIADDIDAAFAKLARGIRRPEDLVTEIPHAKGSLANLPNKLKADFSRLTSFIKIGADKILNAKITLPATPEAEFKQSAAKLAGSQEFLTAVNRHRFGAQRPDTPGEKQTTLMERMLEVLRAIEGKPPLEVKTFSKSAILHGNFGGTA